MTLPRHILVATAICAAYLAQSVPVYAQDGSGRLSFGASVSSLHGVIGTVGLSAENIKDTGISASVRAKAGKDGYGWTANLDYGRDIGAGLLGSDSKLELYVTGAASNWESDGYSTESISLGGALSASIAPDLRHSLGVFLRSDTLSGLAVGASPLIAAAMGDSTAAGLSYQLVLDRMAGDAMSGQGYRIGLEAAVAPLGSRNWASLDLSASAAMPITQRIGLKFSGGTGMITGINGATVGLVDRAFLGGTAGPRGFADGSVGPRDYVPNGVNSALGGNRYVQVSGEATYALTSVLSLGLFADAGAVWDLDGTQIGAMGAIDDSLNLRSSVGLSVYWQTSAGTVALSVAHAVSKQDGDQITPIQLSIGAQF